MAYSSTKRTLVRGSKLLQSPRDFLKDGAFPIGQHFINPRALNTHLLGSGPTGTGKTQMLLPMLDYLTHQAVSDPNTILICTDPGGIFTSMLYDPDRDTLWNPMDARSVLWSPFAEIKTKTDTSAVSEAIIPPTKDSKSEEWRGEAVTFLTNVFDALLTSGSTRIGDSPASKMETLLRCLVDTPENRRLMADLLKDTSSATFFVKGGRGDYLHSVLGVTSKATTGLRILNPNGGFSAKAWLRSAVSGQGPRILWIPYRGQDREALVGPIRAVLNILVSQLISLPTNPNRRVFFVIDELDSLGLIPKLQTLLTEGRKYGAAVLAFIQVMAQLRVTTGGKDHAEILLDNMKSKLILGNPNVDSSEYFSKLLGTQDIHESTVAASSATDWDKMGSGSQSHNEKIERKVPVVPPEEIMGLPTRNGFLLLDGYSNSKELLKKHSPASLLVWRVQAPITDFGVRQPDFVEVGDLEEGTSVTPDPAKRVPRRFAEAPDVAASPGLFARFRQALGTGVAPRKKLASGVAFLDDTDASGWFPWAVYLACVGVSLYALWPYLVGMLPSVVLGYLCLLLLFVIGKDLGRSGVTVFKGGDNVFHVVEALLIHIPKITFQIARLIITHNVGMFRSVGAAVRIKSLLPLKSSILTIGLYYPLSVLSFGVSLAKRHALTLVIPIVITLLIIHYASPVLAAMLHV